MSEKKQGFWGKVRDWIGGLLKRIGDLLKRVVEQEIDRIDDSFKRAEQEKSYIPKFQIGDDFLLKEKGVMRNAVGGKGIVKIPAKVTRIENAYKDDWRYEKFRNAVKKSQYVTGWELPIGLRAVDKTNIGQLRNFKNIYIPDLVDFCKCKINGEVWWGRLYVKGELTQDLILPDSVDRICAWQFYGFFIKSVTVPAGVKTIEKKAFNAHVEKFIFEGKEIKLDEYFFRDFSNLKEIVVLNDELEFEPSIFTHCGELERITYPNNPAKTCVLIDPEKDCKVENGELVRYVGHASKVTVPNYVEKIGSSAFAGNGYLQEIVIPDSVKEIGAKCFEECWQLKLVQLPSTLQSVADFTFKKCSSLKKICLPDNVTEIGANAFEYCRKLKEIELGKGVKKIGKEAFHYCEQLEEIVLPSVAEVGESAFVNCNRLKKLVMEGDVEYIGDNAFENLYVDLFFLGSVKKIGKGNLTLDKEGVHTPKVHIRDISVWSNAEVFYEKPKKTLNCELAYQQFKNARWSLFCNGKEVKELVIPESVETIPTGNFYGCQSIEKVRFQGKIKSIGGFAFCGCRSLESVELPDSLQEIDECAFMGCSLKEISLPESITAIKRGTFAKCDLGFVKLPSGLTSIEAYAFADNQFLANVRFPQKLKTDGKCSPKAFDASCECK